MEGSLTSVDWHGVLKVGIPMESTLPTSPGIQDADFLITTVSPKRQMVFLLGGDVDGVFSTSALQNG